jgi:hypothetical protein
VNAADPKAGGHYLVLRDDESAGIRDVGVDGQRLVRDEVRISGHGELHFAVDVIEVAKADVTQVRSTTALMSGPPKRIQLHFDVATDDQARELSAAWQEIVSGKTTRIETAAEDLNEIMERAMTGQDFMRIGRGRIWRPFAPSPRPIPASRVHTFCRI